MLKKISLKLAKKNVLFNKSFFFLEKKTLFSLSCLPLKLFLDLSIFSALFLLFLSFHPTKFSVHSDLCCSPFPSRFLLSPRFIANFPRLPKCLFTLFTVVLFSATQSLSEWKWVFFFPKNFVHCHPTVKSCL